MVRNVHHDIVRERGLHTVLGKGHLAKGDDRRIGRLWREEEGDGCQRHRDGQPCRRRAGQGHVRGWKDLQNSWACKGAQTRRHDAGSDRRVVRAG